MNKRELEAFGREVAKGIKTEDDLNLNDFRKMLTKVMVEAALNAELDHHLGFDKNEVSRSGNYRNGSMSKTLRTEDGQFEVDTPRDFKGLVDGEQLQTMTKCFRQTNQYFSIMRTIKVFT